MIGKLNILQENIRLLRADVEELQMLARMQNIQIENLESRMDACMGKAGLTDSGGNSA